MAQLIAERLTGTVAESYQSPAMLRGSEVEEEARSAYSFAANSDIDEVAFVEHAVLKDTGASPDGLVGPHGLVEIKCPNTATHIDTLLTGKIPKKYITQMQWQLACTTRHWCDYVSYDPRMPEDMRLFIKRVPEDTTIISELETEVSKFLVEMEQKIDDLKAPYLSKEAAE